jgi:hypothetical protein
VATIRYAEDLKGRTVEQLVEETSIPYAEMFTVMDTFT